MAMCELVNIVNFIQATAICDVKMGRKTSRNKVFTKQMCSGTCKFTKFTCSQGVFGAKSTDLYLFSIQYQTGEGFLNVLLVLMLTTMSVSHIFAMRIDMDSVNIVNLPFLKFTECSQKIKSSIWTDMYRKLER